MLYRIPLLIGIQTCQLVFFSRSVRSVRKKNIALCTVGLYYLSAGPSRSLCFRPTSRPVTPTLFFEYLHQNIHKHSFPLIYKKSSQHHNVHPLLMRYQRSISYTTAAVEKDATVVFLETPINSKHCLILPRISSESTDSYRKHE